MSAMLWLNILLMTVFFGLWVGIPTWLVLRRPDRRPMIAAAPAVRRMPESSTARAGYEHRRVA
ncbi:MAG: hypothetical protein JO345_34660 [Streptosporangiaceae bacterium]|nr:hypothetical protein [Streptosporangiaceae bacterium]